MNSQYAFLIRQQTGGGRSCLKKDAQIRIARELTTRFFSKLKYKRHSSSLLFGSKSGGGISKSAS